MVKSKIVVFAIPLLVCLPLVAGESVKQARPIQLRCWGVPDPAGTGVESIVQNSVLQAFHDAYPDIQANSSTGLVLAGSETMDMVPLLQVAGGIPADCMYVNFRQTDTYIRKHKLLYPLDGYVEALAYATPQQIADGTYLRESQKILIPNGHLKSCEEYVSHLRSSAPNWDQISRRIPENIFPVIFRRCPYGTQCEFLMRRGVEQPQAVHRHLWSFPVGPVVMGLSYRRDLFAEAGLPDRVPRDWDEMLEWGKRLTEPSERRYGLKVYNAITGWQYLMFLYSMGGKLVEEDASGDWQCSFDSPEAIEAAYFMARLKLERFKTPNGKTAEGIIYSVSSQLSDVKVGMESMYLDQRFFMNRDPTLYNFGPVPLGRTNKRGSELNAQMMGIYAGLADDPAQRDAAWKYLYWYDGPQARKIRTQVYVENGFGRFVNPSLLKEHGYPELVRQVPPGWDEAYQEARAHGVPEPYGKNCQRVYDYPSKAISQIWDDRDIRAAIHAGDAEQAKQRIAEILSHWVKVGNSEMLQRFTPTQLRWRLVAAWVTVGLAVVSFSFVFYRVFKFFTPEQLVHSGGWQFRRFAWCYFLLIPAVGTILLWQYYPLARGTVMAFQDYNVRGFSKWIGMENFAYALFDRKFWFSLYVSLKYAVLYMLFAFFAPIFLAMLLQEVPRGKIIYRVIYYLPAVLTGAVVLFLWKSFYSTTGPVNQLVGYVVDAINLIFRTEIEYLPIDWLNSKTFALPFCLLPTIWSGMGPGCLIYLAALKTVPEEMYEAADIDGAGIWHKVFHIAIPSIKVLVMINFIFALVGAIRGSAGFMLAMTGGGPYGHTEVVGLQIFYTAFAKLNFGLATAQAWILGTILIGFTVYQLKRLSQVEYRTAEKIG